MVRALFALHPPLLFAAFAAALTWLSYGLAAPLLLVALLDVRGRSRDWRYLRGKPEAFFTPTVMRRFGASWCGRSLICAASPSARHHYHKDGYRLWHVFPDGMFRRDSVLLYGRFWVNLFGGHAAGRN